MLLALDYVLQCLMVISMVLASLPYRIVVEHMVVCEACYNMPRRIPHDVLV